MNNIKQVYLGLSIFLISVFSLCVSAHEDGASHQGSSATYLGNEGVLISSSIGKCCSTHFSTMTMGLISLFLKGSERPFLMAKHLMTALMWL